MIQSITVMNHLGDSLELELANPDTTGIAVVGIAGLGPPKGAINKIDLTSGDGAVFSSARLDVRNIVLSLKFLWAPTIEDVRLKTYRFFPVKKPLTFIVKTDNRTVKTVGYVESNEPSIFSQNEGCQISIICPDPYFYKIESDGLSPEVQFDNLEPLFEFAVADGESNGYFEFVYDLSTSTEEHKVFSSLDESEYVNVTYNGDADTGFTIRMQASGPVTNPAIYNATTNEVLRLKTTMAAGDLIEICTLRGKKRITKTGSDLVISNIINSLSKESSWLYLQQGVNTFTYLTENASEKSNLSVTIVYDTIYEGV